MYIFCAYKQCSNYTKCIQMLIESYMLLMMYFFCMQNLYILYFLNLCVNDAIFHSVLQLCKILGPIFLYWKIYIWIYIIDLFSINLIYFNYNICYIIWSIFFLIYILFIKIQVIFINFPIPYFLAKKSCKFYFLKHNQQHIDLSHNVQVTATYNIFSHGLEQ